ncbi:MAG: helix-turn-helix transcriptional regulator [Lachnospiraceae bacterium]|nr:helix-turn-helix transcriptional regulator [Lachnospiraceae bacterium]
MKMITFDPLWQILKTKGMNKGDLQKAVGISSSTVARLIYGWNNRCF